MKITKDQIMGALPHLSQSELAVIKALVVALLHEKAPEAPNAADGPQGWLLEAMQMALGMSHQLPRNIKHFGTNAPEFIRFIRETFPKDPLRSKVTALGVMRMLLGLIIEDLKGKQVPVSMGTVTINLTQIAKVFDEAFPGYRQSGLVGLIMPTAEQPEQQSTTELPLFR